MFSSKQTHMFDYFICYHLESGSQQGSFSREMKEPGNEVVKCVRSQLFFH